MRPGARAEGARGKGERRGLGAGRGNGLEKRKGTRRLLRGGKGRRVGFWGGRVRRGREGLGLRFDVPCFWHTKVKQEQTRKRDGRRPRPKEGGRGWGWERRGENIVQLRPFAMDFMSAFRDLGRKNDNDSNNNNEGSPTFSPCLDAQV